MSKTPWHMMTDFPRGRRPMASSRDARVLILCSKFGFIKISCGGPDAFSMFGKIADESLRLNWTPVRRKIAIFGFDVQGVNRRAFAGEGRDRTP